MSANPMYPTTMPTTSSVVYPPNGGMGPNVVMNFSQPNGYPGTTMTIGSTAPPPATINEGVYKVKEERIVHVQGDPTFRNPRRVTRIGNQPPRDPCVIM